jgi:hypothetical protein
MRPIRSIKILLDNLILPIISYPSVYPTYVSPYLLNTQQSQQHAIDVLNMIIIVYIKKMDLILYNWIYFCVQTVIM